MKLFCITIQLFLIVVILKGQESSLKSSDYDQFYPEYFDAIAEAANGEFSSALPAFSKMVMQFPHHLEANLLIDICRDAIKKNISVNAAEFFFEALNTRYNFAETDEIIFLFDRAIGEEENYFPFYLIRGNYFAFIKQYEYAHSDFSLVIQLQPNSAIGYYARGKLSRDHQMNMQALSDFNKALQLNPKYSSAYIQRARIYAKMNETHRAFNDFYQAFSLDSTSIKSLENSAILNNMSTVWIGQEKYKDALESLNLAIIADNRWYEPFLNRGIANKSLKQFEHGIKDLKKAIELKPKIGKSYYNLGLIYKEKKEFGQAKSNFEIALEFEDTEPRVYFMLAEVSVKLNEYNKATQYYKTALNKEPDNIWAYYQLASLYDKRRGFAEAVKYYNEFINRASNDYFEHKIKAKDRSDRIKRYMELKNK